MTFLKLCWTYRKAAVSGRRGRLVFTASLQDHTRTVRFPSHFSPKVRFKQTNLSLPLSISPTVVFSKSIPPASKIFLTVLEARSSKCRILDTTCMIRVLQPFASNGIPGFYAHLPPVPGASSRIDKRWLLTRISACENDRYWWSDSRCLSIQLWGTSHPSYLVASILWNNLDQKFRISLRPPLAL